MCKTNKHIWLAGINPILFNLHSIRRELVGMNITKLMIGLVAGFFKRPFACAAALWTNQTRI